jgi:hypothetical protein
MRDAAPVTKGGGGCPTAWSRQTKHTPFMNDTERIQKHHGGPHTEAGKPHAGARRPLHHSPFFWVAAFFIFLAMAVFVFTDGFLLRPRGRAPAPSAGSAG